MRGSNVNKGVHHRKEMEKRGEIVWDQLISWLLALVVLALVVFLYLVLSGKLGGAADFLKGVLRIGR